MEHQQDNHPLTLKNAADDLKLAKRIIPLKVGMHLFYLLALGFLVVSISGYVVNSLFLIAITLVILVVVIFLVNKYRKLLHRAYIKPIKDTQEKIGASA